MKFFKKHISLLLLLAFCWLSVPVSITHTFFADHEDTHCETEHAGVTRVETPHTHCEVFKVQSPVYDLPELFVLESPRPVLVSVVSSSTHTFKGLNFHLDLPGRGPPV